VDINRNHWFFLGLVLLFLGLQFRMVHSVVLNDKSSQFVTQKFGSSFENAIIKPLEIAGVPSPRRVLEPPDWIGWSLVAVAAVLLLHSLAMPKPG